jgi:hypothetical protein
MPTVPIFRRGADLVRLLDDVAAVDWRNPLWWAVVGAAAALGGPAAADVAYLASDGEPAADTFIGWTAEAPADAADAIARAIALAHATAAAVDALDGELPGQPLCRRVERDLDAGGAPGLARAAPHADARQVAFVIGARAYLATLDVRGAAADLELAAALARAVLAAAAPDLRDPAARLRLIDPDGPAVTAAIACVIGDLPLTEARHAHRRAWSIRGGPWLGVATAGGLAVISTCHMVVDGFGHAWLARRIAAAEASIDRGPLRAAAAGVLARAPAPPLPATTAAPPLGIAWRTVPTLPRLPVLGHALGRVLWRDADRPGASRSPTFQVPVAPGAPDDPLRLRRRVVPALLSVRFAAGVAEPIEAFGQRARATIARECAGTGLMAQLTTAARAAPGSLTWKRRAVAGSARPGLFAPAARVLGGRACLSLLRSGPGADHAPPLYAVSSPAVPASSGDPHGSCVLTILDSALGSTITISGLGATGTARGAEALLDRWLAAIVDVP